MNLSWTAATDNVGVTGYRVERCQGAGCTNFTEVATPTATTYNDTGRSASTTYRYRVRAADAAGNLGGYSTIADATTSAAPSTPPGLVGAWGFAEGAGSTTADASGNGNAGTITERHVVDPGPLRQRPELQRHEQRGASAELGVAEPDDRR